MEPFDNQIDFKVPGFKDETIKTLNIKNDDSKKKNSKNDKKKTYIKWNKDDSQPEKTFTKNIENSTFKTTQEKTPVSENILSKEKSEEEEFLKRIIHRKKLDTKSASEIKIKDFKQVKIINDKNFEADEDLKAKTQVSESFSL